MMKSLFEQKKNWYKGNLHAHTTRSDGGKTPEEVVELYQERDYDFLALTDHRKPGSGGKYKNMLLLQGAEWDYGNNREYPVYHILAIGTESTLELPEYYQQGTLPCGNKILPQDIIDRIAAAGGIAFLAHPAWSVMSPEEIFLMHGLAGAEIFNSVSRAPWNADRADASLYFDLWAKKGLYMPCIATDDSHFYQGEEACGFTMVHCDELEEKSVLEALRNGNFYASQGPRFEAVWYDEEKVSITCSGDVARIIVYSNAAWADKRVFDQPQGTVTYQISPSDGYIRIELMDFQGRKAWSRPFAV